MPGRLWSAACCLARRHAGGLCALFFVCLLFLGWLTAGAYGTPWDEPNEMDILRMNLWEYARSLGLGDAVFQDWALEKAGEDSLLDAPVPISQSVERDHGVSAYYPLAGLMMSGQVSPSARAFWWRAHTWLLFWLGAVALFAVCRRLGLSRGISCLSVVMLLLSPRFFAEGHYNNKDIVLMALVTVTLWQSLRLWEKPDVPTALAFALSGALAANTKVIGLFCFGLCGLFAALRLGLEKRLDKRAVTAGLTALTAFAVFYALLTPALWASPAAFFAYLLRYAVRFTRWQGYVLFRGVVFDTSLSSPPWYYLPYMMLVTTPLWIWLFAVAGQLVAVWGLFTRDRETLARRLPLLLCTLLWAVPLGLAIVTRTRVYNGWRHFYFLYGPLLVLAACGLSWLWNRVRPIRWQRRLTAVLLAAVMALTGAGMVRNHPYQYVYYNELAAGRELASRLELDYWNVSVANALKALFASEACQSLDKPPLIRGVDLWAQEGVNRSLKTMEGGEALLAVQEAEAGAVFWVVNHTYQRYSGWQPGPGMTPVARAEAYGHPLVTVYRAEPGADGESAP